VGDAVDIERSFVERVFVRPVGVGRFGVDEMERPARVVEVGEVKFRIGVRGDLVLGLGDEELMFVLHEEISLRCVQENELAVHSRGGGRVEPISALDFDLDRVVLHRHEWEASGEITVTEEERNEVVITGTGGDTVGVALDGGGRDGTGGEGLIGVVEDVVHALDEEGVQHAHLLTPDPEGKLSRVRRRGAVQTGGARGAHGIGRRDARRLDPHVRQQITLRRDRDRNLIVASERPDVVDPLRLHTERAVTLVVLSPEGDFGLTGEVGISHTSADEFNQSATHDYYSTHIKNSDYIFQR